MRTNSFANSPIDHYIQADLVKSLYTNGQQSFTALKPAEIENSLFMYHVNKLINRGVVAKSEQGFELTLQGLRWVNFVGPTTLQPVMLPRLLINFIITNNDKTKILISKRKGPAAENLNTFLLPGGLHPYGLRQMDAVVTVAESMNLPLGTDYNYVCIYEIVNQHPDGFVHHSVSSLFEGSCKEEIFPETENYILNWVALDEVIANTDNRYEEPLHEIVNDYVCGTLKPYNFKEL